MLTFRFSFMMAVAGKYRDMGTMVEGKIEVRRPLDLYFPFLLLRIENYLTRNLLFSVNSSSMLHI